MPSIQTMNRQAFASSVVILGVMWISFSSMTQKKAGHGMFDVQKPEAVQDMQDSAQKKKK